MRPASNWIERESDEAVANRQTASLAALALMLALVVVGLGLVHVLRHESRLEDCFLAGRSDCDVMADLPQ